MVRVLVVAIAVVWRCALASATSYAPPMEHDVRSPDGQFVLHVDPKADVLSVARASDPAHVLWSARRDRIQFESHYVANGGERIAIVSWQFVQVDDLDDPAVEILAPTGIVAKYSVRDLIGQPPYIRGVGPIGDFWREWLASERQVGDRLILETTGLFTYEIDLRSGGRARAIRPLGAAMLAGGLVLIALAIFVVVRTRRTRSQLEWASERRRYLFADAAIVGALLWFGLDIAGIPLAPPDLVAWLQLALLAGTLVMVPVSLLATAKLPPGARWLRVLATLAVAPAIICFKIFY